MSQLRDFVEKIESLFNGNNLDALMDGFAPDAIFEDAQGDRFQGKAAIKATFSPLFEGAQGPLRFDWTETILDEAANKAVVAWTLSMYRDGEPVSVRGLDIFKFDQGLVVSKATYTKGLRRPAS